MSGNRSGGLKAAKTNKERYGDTYYADMGRKGGMNGHTGGFASNPERARIAGAKGGRASKRGENLQKKLDEVFSSYINEQIEEGKSIHAIAQRIGVSDYTIKRYALRHGIISDKYTKQPKYYAKKS